MNALREEFPMENDTVEADLRDLRKSVDQKIDNLDAKFDVWSQKQEVRFEKQDAKQITLLEKLDARFERQDERFERRDAKIDLKFEKMDAKFASKLEALSTRQYAAWLALITAGATIAATVLTIMFGGPHGH
jgi:uncharacterized membrane protein YccC